MYDSTRTLILASFVFASFSTSPGQEAASPVRFVENCGQWGDHVRFAQMGPAAQLVVGLRSFGVIRERRRSQREAEGVLVRFAFEGAEPISPVEASGRSASRFSFLRGQEEEDWIRDLPSFSRLRLRDVWPGVDVALLEREGALAYDIHLDGDADLGEVVIRCEGADALRLDPEGSLVIETALGCLRQSPPRSWLVTADGRTMAVASEFRLLGGMRFGFRVDPEALRDGERLVVDPRLEWSTLLGTPASDYVHDVGTDSAGSVYVTGFATDRRFPTTPGAYCRQWRNGDCFVTKFDASGSSLVYSTFVGGGGADLGLSLDVLPDGTALVGGSTTSDDFPVTSRAAQGSLAGGGSDAFLCVLNRGGNDLVYSTYLGGSIGEEGVRSLRLRDSIVVVGGHTTSPDFPLTANAWDRTYNDTGPFYLGDVFLSAIDLRSGALLYSTLLGGASGDSLHALQILSPREVLLAGQTESPDFPITSGAFDETYDGHQDGFVTRFDLVAGRPVYSTRLGGASGSSAALAVAVAEAGSAVVAGSTDATDFPTTSGAYDTSHAGGGSRGTDAFIAKLDPEGANLVWSTFLGGRSDELLHDLRLDSRGSVVVTGQTQSADYPLRGRVEGPRGDYDVFVSRLDASGADLRFSSLLGSSSFDEGLALELDDRGFATVTGVTNAGDFPTTSGAYDTRWDLYRDVFVTRLRTGPVLRLEGSPAAGNLVRFLVEGAAEWEEGHRVQVLLSGSGTAGIPLPGGGLLPLTFDGFTSWSLSFPVSCRGTIDEVGECRLGAFSLPPLLSGMTLWASGFLWGPDSGQVSVVMDAIEIVIQ